jgi:hypothetical protein
MHSKGMVILTKEQRMPLSKYLNDPITNQKITAGRRIKPTKCSNALKQSKLSR